MVESPAGRNFALLWSGNALSLIGFHGTRMAGPLLVLALTGSPAAAGWVGFAFGAPSLLFPFVAGVVADRYNRILTLRICQVVGLATAAAVAVAVSLDLPGLVPVVVAAAFVEGAVYIFVDVVELGAVCDIVPEARRRSAISFLEAEQPIAALLGRAAGGAIFGLARWLPYAVDVATYLYCLIALTLIRRDKPAPPRPVATRRPSAQELTAGLRVVWNEPQLRATTLGVGLSNIIIQLVLLLILFDLDHSGRPAWVTGAVLAAAGVGGIVGAAIGARLLVMLPNVLVYRTGLWVWTALLAGIAVSDDPIVLALCWGGVGAVGVAGNVALTNYRVEVIADAVLGRAMAAMGLIVSAAVAFGALGAGYLLSMLGTDVARWSSLAAMFGLASVMGGSPLQILRRSAPAV